MIAQKGNRVRLELTGQLETREVFAVASPESPLEIVLGQAQVFEPMEQALLGRARGASATVWVSPHEDFGEHDPDKVHVLPRNKLVSGVGNKLGERVKVAPHVRKSPYP